MITGIKKFNIFLVITFGLILMSLIFPQNHAYAGTKDVITNWVFDFFTADGNIEGEFFQKVIDDAIQNNINIAGFETRRFETEEQEAKFRAAVVTQQVKNFFDDFKNSKNILEAGKMVVNYKEHLSKNLQKSVEQVNKLIEESGGNIDAVKLELENFEILGIKAGKKIINMFGDVTPDEYANLRKLDEQLTREAYVELGVSELPQDILDGLFIMSNNKEAFLENFKKMSKSDQKWFEESKTYYTYSAELTKEAVDLMEAAGLSSMKELNQFYMNNKHQIRNMDDLKALTANMKKDREDLLSLLAKAKPVKTKEALRNSGDATQGKYILDSGLLSLFANTQNQYNSISVQGAYGGIKFDSAEDYQKFMIAWEKFKRDYNWEFNQRSPNFQRLFTFYQTSPGDLDDPIRLAGNINAEYHTFVSKVIFKITKKKGLMSNMDIADMAELNQVALKYNNKFAKVYERLTGNASPVPKVKKEGDSIVVELDYYEGIRNSNSKVYDAIRNNWSLIRGGHSRPSLDYRGSSSSQGFVPTIAFKNVKERGVYEVEAVIFGSRYYQYEKTYTRYYNCTDDEDGHHHGNREVVKYYPYRKKVIDEHSLPITDDTRNIAPDHIVENNVIGRAIWEVNVGENGRIWIPAYGVDSSDIRTSNFISK
jgi:hypothetical protein